jgi:hypothetical protein
VCTHRNLDGLALPVNPASAVFATFYRQTWHFILVENNVAPLVVRLAISESSESSNSTPCATQSVDITSNLEESENTARQETGHARCRKRRKECNNPNLKFRFLSLLGGNDGKAEFWQEVALWEERV